jgi:uncharacterized protein (DUF433 family)
MAISIDVYNDPCYTLKDAQLHIHVFNVPKTTVNDWVGGRSTYTPLIEIAQKSPPRLSFINLIELYVLATLRRRIKIQMPYVREAIDFVKKEFESEHPLAEHKFKTDGLHIFLDVLGKTHDISTGGQQTFEFVSNYLERVEYSFTGKPTKFYPFSSFGNKEEDKPKYVTIDPNICFGRPVLESISVPVESICDQYWAGESHATLISDYQVTSEELDEAIRIGRYYLEAA